MAKVEELVSRYDSLKGDRQNLDSWLEDLAKFCVPRKARIITDRITGERYTSDIYDSTARDSVKIWAAGMMGNLTNPATLWHKWKAIPEEINESLDSRVWLMDVTRIIHSVLASSNFYEEIQEFYMGLPVFGTVGFSTEEDTREIVRYHSDNIKGFYFDTDSAGRVNFIFRCYKYNARQAFDKWGANAGKNVLDHLEKGDLNTKFEFVHVIGERGERNVGKIDSRNKPFFSIWINRALKKIVAEGGFEEFPMAVGFFEKEDEERYGFSAAMDVLQDIKSANELKKIMLQTGAAQGAPPIILPHDGYILPLDRNPHGVNFKNRGFGTGDEKIEFLRPDGDINALRALLEDDRMTIRKAFFVDLFKALEMRKDASKTATEVMEIIQESMVLLGPTVNRVNNVLKQTLERTYKILERQGMIPEPPPEMAGVPMNIVMTSRLEVAQRFSESQGLSMFLQMVGGLAGLKPEALDNVNADEVVKLISKFTGVDPSIMESEDVVRAIRQQRQEAQMALQEAQALREGASGAKDVGQAAKAIAEAV